MKTINDKYKYFRTTNFTLALFLYTKDQQIAGINPVNDNQKEFAFIASPHLEELVDLYKFGDRSDDRLLVEVHKYEQGRRDLLDRLND